MNRLFLLFIAFLFCSCTSLLQKQGQKNYRPFLPKKEEYREYNKYQKDFIHLVALCEEGFPLIDTYFPENERKELQQATLEKLGRKGINDQIFTLATTYYLARFRNQHTFINSSTSFSGTFPFIAYNQDSSWYLRNIGTAYDSTLIGRKIVAINQESIASFAQKAGMLLAAENKVSIRKAVVSRQLLNRSELLFLAGIIPQADSILLEVEGEAPFWVPTITDRDELNLYAVKARPHPVTAPGKRHFNYEVFPEKDLAYLQIRKFHDREDILDVMKTYVRP